MRDSSARDLCHVIPTITDEHIDQMILWITGHYDRRILPLETIAKEACGINAPYRTLISSESSSIWNIVPPKVTVVNPL